MALPHSCSVSSSSSSFFGGYRPGLTPILHALNLHFSILPPLIRIAKLAGVLIFSAIPFTAVKAIANSPLENKKATMKNSSNFQVFAEKARNEREHVPVVSFKNGVIPSCASSIHPGGRNQTVLDERSLSVTSSGTLCLAHVQPLPCLLFRKKIMRSTVHMVSSSSAAAA